MKRFLLLLAIFFPIAANSMKIVTDKIDEFTGGRTVITSWEHLSMRRINIRFRLQDGETFLDFKFIPDNAIVISENSKLLFKSSSDGVGTFTSVAMYHGGRGEGSVGLNMSGLWGISATYAGDLSWFSDNTTNLIRVYATDGYYDRKVSEKEGVKLQNLYTLFYNTITAVK